MPKISGSFNGRANWLTTIPQRDVAGQEVNLVEIAGKQRSEDPHWNNASVTYWGVGDVIAGNGTQRGCFINQHADGDCDRGAFEAQVTTTGGQPIPAVDKLSFAGMAKEAGYAAAYQFDSLEEFATEVEGILRQRGPVFVCLKVRHEDIPADQARPMKQAVQELRALLAKT